MRKSPTTHAADTKVGTVKKGNDGKMWIVILTSDGIHRWRHLVSANRANCKCYPKRDPVNIRLGSVFHCKHKVKWKTKTHKNTRRWVLVTK